MAVQVYFIGAGPGNMELLTVKARKIIETADVIVYADSLINPEVCGLAKNGADIHRSSSLTLEEITGIMVKAARQGKTVARLQSGDPAIYGAIAEQMALLDENSIEYQVVPGVSSALAAAAALKTELTVPGLSQTVIISRVEGRTSVPLAENLRSLATHQAAIVLFLSVSLVERAVSDLVQGGYPPDTPAALVYRVTWKDELIVRCTLGELGNRVKEHGIKKQALILVGKFLERKKGPRSKLYDRDFKHEYR